MVPKCLLDLPNEIILKILEFIIPTKLSTAGGPFNLWTTICHSQTITFASDNNNLRNLRKTCMKFEHILPCYSIHTHVDELSWGDFFTKSEGHSIGSLLDWERRDYSWEMKLSENYEKDYRNLSNTWTTELYLMSFEVRWKVLKWLLTGLPNLKVLYFKLDPDRDPEFTNLPLRELIPKPKVTNTSLIDLLSVHTQGLEKLIITREYDTAHRAEDPRLQVSLRALSNLYSLSCSFQFIRRLNSQKLYRILPSKLAELEVCYDQDMSGSFITNNRAMPDRPQWLFDLLAKKAELFPSLRRIRISGSEWIPERRKTTLLSADFWHTKLPCLFGMECSVRIKTIGLVTMETKAGNLLSKLSTLLTRRDWEDAGVFPWVDPDDIWYLTNDDVEVWRDDEYALSRLQNVGVTSDEELKALGLSDVGVAEMEGLGIA